MKMVQLGERIIPSYGTLNKVGVFGFDQV